VTKTEAHMTDRQLPCLQCNMSGAHTTDTTNTVPQFEASKMFHDNTTQQH